MSQRRKGSQDNFNKHAFSQAGTPTPASRGAPNIIIPPSSPSRWLTFGFIWTASVVLFFGLLFFVFLKPDGGYLAFETRVFAYMCIVVFAVAVGIFVMED